MRRSAVALLGLILAALLRSGALAAQQDDDRWLRDCERGDHNDKREHVCEIRRLGFKPAGGMLVFTPDPNGGVEVRGWDRDSVDVSARIQTEARDQDGARAIAKEIRVRTAGGRVEVDGPDSHGNSGWGVMLVVQVPRRSDLRAETTNGPLSVEQVTGTIELRTRNGPVSLWGVGGDVSARVENGPLTVELAGREWSGKGLDAESVNGPVDLAIPEGYNASLETGTVNGPAEFRLPITVTLKGRRQDRIQTTLGKGGAPIRVVTTNGPLTIRKASS